MEYELIIIWSTGEKDIEVYSSKEKAEEARINYKIAFGGQISWAGIREKRR